MAITIIVSIANKLFLGEFSKVDFLFEHCHRDIAFANCNALWGFSQKNILWDSLEASDLRLIIIACCHGEISKYNI